MRVCAVNLVRYPCVGDSAHAERKSEAEDEPRKAHLFEDLKSKRKEAK
jgi:hypothetical protein